MLIYFQPAFYCNVNDAWTFPDLRARLWVTAAGSWIQLVLAALAAIVWWVAQPGTLISQLALFLVVIGGVTTVVANAKNSASCEISRSEEHTSELQSRLHLVCRLLLEKKK